MYIRSQDKLHFGIYINLDISPIKEQGYECFISSMGVILGAYATQKRCIEIVDEISNIIERQHSLTQEKAEAESHLVYMRFAPEKAVYQMPKE